MAFSDVSFIDENGRTIDDYTDYLFIFSINGIFLLAVAIAAVNAFNIGISEIRPLAITTLVSVISAVLSVLTRLWQQKREHAKLRGKIDTREEIKKELVEDILSEIEKLRNADNQQEELNKFPQLALYIQQCRHDFTEPDDFDPIFEEIEEIDSVSEGLEDSIIQDFTEAREYVRDKVMQEASIDEKQKRLEEEYENIIFEEESTSS